MHIIFKISHKCNTNNCILLKLTIYIYLLTGFQPLQAVGISLSNLTVQWYTSMYNVAQNYKLQKCTQCTMTRYTGAYNAASDILNETIIAKKFNYNLKSEQVGSIINYLLYAHQEKDLYGIQ